MLSEVLVHGPLAPLQNIIVGSMWWNNAAHCMMVRKQRGICQNVRLPSSSNLLLSRPITYWMVSSPSSVGLSLSDALSYGNCLWKHPRRHTQKYALDVSQYNQVDNLK
jgi:hypothetical protein